MTVEYSIDNGTLSVKVAGRFDFSVHQDFRKMSTESVSLNKINIDLSRVDYIDSSALGMLLILRDKVGERKEAITLINARPEILKILKISNFDRLFALQ